MNSTSNLLRKFFLVLAAVLCIGGYSHAQQCPTGTTSMSITIVTDAQPQQTTFNLYELATGNVLFSVSPTNLPPNSTLNYNVCVPSGGCVKGDLLDSNGDGGSDFYLTYNGQVYTSPLGANFGHLNTIVVGPASCSDFSQINDSTAYVLRSSGGIVMGKGNKIGGPVLANPSSGDICMGPRNRVNGWVRGRKLQAAPNNVITGKNNVELFGLDYNLNGCTTTSGIPSNQMGITTGPMGNVGQCVPEDEAVYGEQNIFLTGGDEGVLDAGNYGNVTVTNGATLFLYNDYYNIENLTIAGGTLKYGGGGGVLCDIFIRSAQVTITFNSTVHANINCDWVIIGDGNEVIGEIQTEDPGTEMQIGNFNSIQKPECPACQEALQNGSKQEEDDGLGLSPDFRVWPNPLQGQEINFHSNEAGELSILNLSGREVYHRPLSEGISTIDLNPEEFPGGMYISRLTTSSGRALHQKFLVTGK